jgi:hypothetical protein
MRREGNEEGSPPTRSIPDAGKYYFGLGRGASYAAAARGDLITIKVGRYLRVPTVAMQRRLAEAK